MRRLVNILFVVSTHAVIGKQSFRFAVANGDAGCCDRLIIGKTLGDLGVQIKQLFKQVSLGVEAIGGEDGFIEGGMGIAQRVFAGQVERAVEGAQAASQVGEGFAADAANFTTGGGDGVDLLFAGGLWPGEGVEDGFGGVAEIGFHFRAFGDKPLPVGSRLQDADAVVVGEGEYL